MTVSCPARTALRIFLLFCWAERKLRKMRENKRDTKIREHLQRREIRFHWGMLEIRYRLEEISVWNDTRESQRHSDSLGKQFFPQTLTIEKVRLYMQYEERRYLHKQMYSETLSMLSIVMSWKKMPGRRWS
jgi:hypothetical protein